MKKKQKSLKNVSLIDTSPSPWSEPCFDKIATELMLLMGEAFLQNFSPQAIILYRLPNYNIILSIERIQEYYYNFESRKENILKETWLHL